MSITSKVLLANGLLHPSLGNEDGACGLSRTRPGTNTHVHPWGSSVIVRWGNYVIVSPSRWGNFLIVDTHPDDAEFWAGGTIAGWSASGVDVSYLVLTDGDAGGVDLATDRTHVPAIRRAEQRRSASLLGVKEVEFLGRHEGELHQGLELRRELVRAIRLARPQRVITWSPEWNWARFRTSCHVDHRATGELALTAVYPDAGNRFAHPALARDGLEPWTVSEIWLLNSPQPDRYVDVTEFFEHKVKAVEAHVSQVGHRGSMTASLRERIAPNAAAAGLPADRLAEAFQVVVNR